MARIVILGGGFGGLATAHGLAPAIAAGHEVTLVDRRDRFTMGLAKLWTLVGERPPDAVTGDLAALERRGVRFVKAEVAAIDLAGRAVRTSAGTYAFDHLVVAMGAETPADGVPGLRPEDNLYDSAAIPGARDRLASLERGAVAIVVFGAPYKCPPAPFEAAMLVHALLARRGVRGAVTLEVAIPDPEPMPIAGPGAAARVRSLLAERGIAFRTGVKPLSVDAAAREVAFASGGRLRYDVLLAVPPHRAPAPVREAGLTDASGYVPVDARTLATAHAGVHAVGDVTVLKLPGAGLLPKAGIMAAREGEVVAANILAALAGKPPERTFDGEGYCFFEVGDRRAMVMEGSFFAEPGRRMRFADPSPEGFARKQQFEREHIERWLGAR